ncbi:MAG: TonB-dependent receptor [Acidobacteria bacterium]|nr:TonB-dependent receptor [Acidobacteriota bacterium]
MRLHKLLFIAILIALALPAALAAGTLTGIVTDPDGKAVPDARVSILRSLVVVGERQTDAEGAYRFENLDDGNYRLTAEAPGLAAAPVEAAVAGDGTETRNLRLKLSAMTTQVVVSSSLGGALLPQLGSSVSLVTGRELEDRAAQNAYETLRGIPGVEVSQTGRRGGVTGVFIRGGESKYNSVMVDGVPMNDFGGGMDMASLPADGIERVEITRGPQSALYGANAVTGVINIVSRRGEGAPEFTALAEGGSYSTRRFATGGSGLAGGFSWAYNLSRLDSDGVVANDHYRNQSAFLNLGYRQGNRRQLEFSFFGNANDAGAPGAYGSDPGGTNPGHTVDTVSRGKQNLFGYRLGHTEQFSSRVRQVTGVSLTTNDLYYISTWGDYGADNLRGLFNTRTEIVLADTASLAAGFEFNREQTKHSYITDDQFAPFLLPRTSLAYFAEGRWSPTGRLHLIGGLRIDHLRTSRIPSDGWTRPAIPASTVVQANPRVSAAYIAREDGGEGAFGSTRLHGSFGTGIRPPDGFELAFTDNPGLKPERNISFDAGVEQALFDSRAIVDVTYFLNRFRDQIVTLGGSVANLSDYTSDNLKNSRAQGLEFTLRVRPVHSLELTGAYTFLDTDILALEGSSEANAPYTVGQPLLRRPRHSGSYGVTWNHRRLTLNTTAYIRGETLDVEPAFGQPFFANPGYVRADAGFAYRLLRGVEVYGRLNNLLNRKYEENLGYPALRLNFMAGMKFRIPSE